MTMIVVTHEMGFAREVGDALIFMDSGAVVESGSAAVRCWPNPQHERTRAFLAKVLLGRVATFSRWAGLRGSLATVPVELS